MSGNAIIPLFAAQQRYGVRETHFPRPVYVHEGLCQWCGRPIAKERAFCTSNCSAAFQEAVGFGRYRNAYINHLMWRDNLSCRECGEFHAVLNPYEIYIPLADNELKIWRLDDDEEDHPDNLISLCSGCRMRAEADRQAGYDWVIVNESIFG